MSGETKPYSNIYKYFVDVTVNSLMQNINTLQEHNLSEDVITNCNQALSDSWTTGDPGGDLQQSLDAVDSDSEMDAWIQKNMTTSDNNVDNFSEAFGTQVMNKLSEYYSSDTGPMDMNVVNSFNSVVQSTANNEEQIGQNLGKTESSVIQQDSSAQQPLADIGTSIEGIDSNIASLLQQTY